MEIDPLWVLVCIGIPLFGIAIFLWGLRSERKQSAKKIEDAKSREKAKDFRRTLAIGIL